MPIKASLLDGIKKIVLPEVWSAGHSSTSLSIRHLSQTQIQLPSA